MFCAFAGAGIGNFVRCKLGKHHFTLFLCIFASVTSACLVYAGLFEVMKLILGVSEQHEAGYICSMLFIIPGFPFITSGIDLAKLDMRSGSGTINLCNHYYHCCNNDCLDYGTYLKIAAGGFSNIKFASPGTNSLPTGSKLLWSFRILCYV